MKAILSTPILNPKTPNWLKGGKPKTKTHLEPVIKQRHYPDFGSFAEASEKRKNPSATLLSVRLSAYRSRITANTDRSVLQKDLNPKP